MKRPTYLEIRIPSAKGTIPSAVRRYFKRQENKVLEIRYGKHITKKIFEYKIIMAGPEKSITYYPEKTVSYLKIVLDLVEDDKAE